MNPYYEQDGIQIYHGDCREVLAALPPDSVDLTLTDPPFSEETHQGARTDINTKLVDFASMSIGDIRDVFAAVGTLTKRWTVSFIDWRHLVQLEQSPPANLRFVRFGIWDKPNGAPQFTGDRPATGWEAVALFHRVGGKMRWNGGGHRAVWTCEKINGAHRTEKPLPLIKRLMDLFSEPGELVLDPFMGSGTTLRAAKDLGRRAIGCEVEERWCEHAADRLRQGVFAFAAGDK